MNRIEGDTHVTGTLTAQSMIPSTGSVSNASVAASAGISATKVQQQRSVAWSQESATDAATGQWVVHTVYGATGSVVGFAAGSVVVASGGGNAVVDLLKNGVSILSSPITLDNTNTARILESAAGFSSTNLVAGDVLEVKITSVAVTKPKGVFVRLLLTEDPN